MIDLKKLEILTNAAKFDVSCSSSGSKRARTAGTFGDTAMGGICHTFTQDGRCVSLLKILLSNNCVYDCLYCQNRRSNDILRASATVDEICQLVCDFYKRNYIEGLFLSSAIEKSPDYTMERLLDVVIKLRKVYGFNGYIHLKGIPGADILMNMRAGAYVDRMSFNLELPSEKSLKLLAPQKEKSAIIRPMRALVEKQRMLEKPKKNRFLPAGQTTQIIVGASPESDGQILRLSQGLYNIYNLKRVYYSSYIPVNKNVSLLPSTQSGILKEHRLYQADWLLRFYGFTADELLGENENLDLRLDPKCAWAIKHMELFPVEINTAPPQTLVKVPGIGFKSAYKIVQARKWGKLDFAALSKMKVVLKRAIHFITIDGKFAGKENPQILFNLLTLSDKDNAPRQLSMFSDGETFNSVLYGEL